MMRDFRVIFQRFVLITSFPALLVSCSIFSKDRDEKYYEKQEQKIARMEEKDYEKRLENHNKMQSEQTRKMMREREREARKLNKHKKR